MFRVLIACLFVSFPALAGYADKYACLDPEAYEMHSGSGLDVTVPQGETWYSRNLWWVKIDGAIVFHRHPELLALPAGTRITSSQHAGGFAYICRPSRVPTVGNPKQAYFARLERLRQLPVCAATKQVTDSAGEAPLIGDNVIVMHVSSHDVAWTILCGPAGCINTTNEVSDVDRIRFAEPIMLPVRTEMFDRIRVAPHRNAAVLPDVRVGTVLYKRLPVDW